jgi:hypothetical protein
VQRRDIRERPRALAAVHGQGAQLAVADLRQHQRDRPEEEIDLPREPFASNV